MNHVRLAQARIPHCPVVRARAVVSGARRDGREERSARGVEQRGLQIDIAVFGGGLKVLLAAFWDDGISCRAAIAFASQSSARDRCVSSGTAAWRRSTTTPSRPNASTHFANFAKLNQSGTSSASPSSSSPAGCPPPCAPTAVLPRSCPDSAALPARGDSSISSVDILQPGAARAELSPAATAQVVRGCDAGWVRVTSRTARRCREADAQTGSEMANCEAQDA